MGYGLLIIVATTVAVRMLFAFAREKGGGVSPAVKAAVIAIAALYAVVAVAAFAGVFACGIITFVANVTVLAYIYIDEYKNRGHSHSRAVIAVLFAVPFAVVTGCGIAKGLGGFLGPILGILATVGILLVAYLPGRRR